MNTSMISLGFIGNNYEDYLHYLTRIFYHLDYEVYVSDMNVFSEVACTLPKWGLEVMDYRGVYFTEDVYIPKEKDKPRTVQIICFDSKDLHEQKELLANCHELYLVSTLNRKELMTIQEGLSRVKNPIKVIRILRDYIKTKHHISVFYNFLEGPTIEVEKDYIFELTEESYTHKLQCQYDDQFKFKGIDKEVKEFLISVVLESTKLPSKVCAKAYRLAERGK